MEQHEGLGHSHVNMSTSPSGQDDKQMEVFADSNDDFFIRIITNKQGNLRLDIYDFESGIIYEQLKYIPNYGEKEEVIRTIQTKIQEYKKKLDEMAKQKEKFIEGAGKNGMAPKDATELFEQIENFTCN